MILAVIPAAGLGTRLGSSVPKLFFELNPGKLVLNTIESALSTLVDECCFIIRPDMVTDFTRLKQNLNSSFLIQEKPIGMGDAIFVTKSKFQYFENILVIWGDQINLNVNTIKQLIESHRSSHADVSVPLVMAKKPYVCFEFDCNSTLIKVRQSREGDQMPDSGLSDVGIFLFKSNGIISHWNAYLESEFTLSPITKEVNFLPFLVYLATNKKEFNFLEIPDVRESVGLNTIEDLRIFKER